MSMTVAWEQPLSSMQHGDAILATSTSGGATRGMFHVASVSPVWFEEQPVGPGHTTELWPPQYTSPQTLPRRSRTGGVQRHQTRVSHELWCSCLLPVCDAWVKGVLVYETLERCVDFYDTLEMCIDIYETCETLEI